MPGRVALTREAPKRAWRSGSGGGSRALLFHTGLLWRLNELGLLPRLKRIPSVSGGSIAAGVLAAHWDEVGFGADGIGVTFEDALCVHAVDTLAQRSCADLSGLDAGLRLADVTWSPDSRHLAFAEEAFRFYMDGDLWLVDAATGVLTNLDDDHYRGLFGLKSIAGTITVPVSPTFTPDGRSVT